MEMRAWMGLAEPRPIDALSLAFFSDALIPAPYMRLPEPAAVPTVDLTVHFRAMPREADALVPAGGPARAVPGADANELIHDGFFVEDGAIWAATARCLRSRASSRS